MGSVLAGRMILEAILHIFSESARVGGGGDAAPHACMIFETVLVDGTMFLKANLHGVKRKAGELGGGRSPPPPHLHTRRLYHTF